jgi:AraC family transcriptional activator of pobA
MEILHFDTLKNWLSFRGLKNLRGEVDFYMYSYHQSDLKNTTEVASYQLGFFEISVEFANACSFSIDNYTFFPACQRISCISPGRTQHVQTVVEGDNKPKGYTLYFHERFLAPLFSTKSLFSQYYFLKPTAFPVAGLKGTQAIEILNYFELIYAEFSQNNLSGNRITASLVLALLEKCRTVYDREVQLNQHRILEELETLFSTQPIEKMNTVTKIADSMNLSPKHLSSELFKLTGKTAKEYINERILDQAMLQLNLTSKSVHEIAFGLGFENPEYFFVFFKRLTGMTPLAFRRKMQSFPN